MESSILDELPIPESDGHLSIPNKPTVFIFGDEDTSEGSYLVTFPGFSILINGASENCKFWNLFRHCSRVDALVMVSDSKHTAKAFHKVISRKIKEKEPSTPVGAVLINTTERKLSMSQNQHLKKLVKSIEKTDILLKFIAQEKTT